MEYPEYLRTYDECPNCGCPTRVVEEEVELEKKLGKIQPERIACSIQKVVPIRDPSGTALIFPVLKVHYDYCTKCGFEYPHIITKEKMTWDQFQAFTLAQMGLTQATRKA